LIFIGIGIFLSATTAVNNRRDTLIIIFERIGNVFRQLENYIEYPRTAGMINVIVKVMIEVLYILAIVTKEIKEKRGETNIEDSLLRLENAIMEEMRMVGAEALVEGIQARNIDHVTGLHLAAKNGDLTTTRLLLEHGTSINARDKRFYTPLHSATLGGNPDVVLLLLERGADLEAKIDNDSTPLHIAVENGKVAAVQSLLDHGADVQARHKDLWTPLHGASSDGNPDVVRLLLERGADLEAKTENHSTPLHIAAENGNSAAVQSLLDRGADVQARRKDLWTPLHRASWDGDPDVVRLLLERGADLKAKSVKHSTPLHIAAENGKFAVAQVLLLKHRSMAYRRDIDSQTPLHKASSGQYLNIIELLLSFLEDRDDIDMQDNEQRTALHLAVDEGKVDALRLLLKHGACVYARNNNRRTPLDLAKARENQEILHLFSEHMRHNERRSI
jgi:cytohesin